MMLSRSGISSIPCCRCHKVTTTRLSCLPSSSQLFFSSDSTDRRINHDFRPRRIILLRHGQSLGNVDESAYVTTADWRIPLTDLGRKQAQGELVVTTSVYIIFDRDVCTNNILVSILLKKRGNESVRKSVKKMHLWCFTTLPICVQNKLWMKSCHSSRRRIYFPAPRSRGYRSNRLEIFKTCNKS